MAIPNLPLWPFTPDWSSDVLEKLEWLTDIMRSPTGAEQRRSLRTYPRRTFEFALALRGPERAYFDNLVMTHGAREFLFPLWHDAHVTTDAIRAGSRIVRCDDPTLGEVRPGGIICFVGHDGFDVELAEVSVVSANGFTLSAPLTRAWSMNTILHPVRRARLTEQPQVRREAGNLITGQVAFMQTELAADNPGASPLSAYRGYPLLLHAPDEGETLDYGYERSLEEIDNATAIPFRYDSAALSFPNQRYRWLLHGREDHVRFRNTLYALRGRSQPIWLPTFFSDFEMAESTLPRRSHLTVKACGFSASGGPRENRRDVLIRMFDGSSKVARITASSPASGGREVLGLDIVFERGLAMDDVQSISFMALARLDQDNIEIAHRTDSQGVSTVIATFRTTPDLRIARAGF